MQPYVPVADYESEKYNQSRSSRRGTVAAEDLPLFIEDREGCRPPAQRESLRRDSENRNDRSDRGDRSERRGRSDRERERDRDRDQGRDRDLDRERDRDRDRDRRRDVEHRSDRDRHDREYGHRDEKYDRRHRSRSRDRGSRDYSSRHGDYRRDSHRESFRDFRAGEDYGRQRRRSPSPPRPFGGLAPETGAHVVPLQARIRPLQNWDAAPKGFELISADKAKLLGIFPPPGNVAKLTSFVPPVLDPALAAMVATLTATGDGEADAAAISALLPGGAAKTQRRLYVAGFPADASDDAIARALNRILGSDVVLNVQTSHDRTYAFVDVRTAEDATALIACDGAAYPGDASTVLRIRRPREYVEGGAVPAAASGRILAQLAAFVPELDRFVITGLPSCLAQPHVKAILEPFGDIRTCALLAPGAAAFECYDAHLGKRMAAELNGFVFGQEALQVRPILEVGLDEADLLRLLSAHGMAPDAATGEPTAVLQLLNAVDEEDLFDNAVYEELLEDVREEAESHGQVLSIQMPRPNSSSEGTPQSGVGRIYIQYSSAEEAARALEAMSGRTFADRTVVAFFYDPDRFSAGVF